MNIIQAIHALHTFQGTPQARKVVKDADRKLLRENCTLYAQWMKGVDGLLSVGPMRIASTGETVYKRVMGNARKRTSGIEDYPDFKDVHALHMELVKDGKADMMNANDVSIRLFAASYAELDPDGWKKG